jgi:hypothetical protein
MKEFAARIDSVLNAALKCCGKVPAITNFGCNKKIADIGQ